MTVSPRLTKFALTVHVVTSVGWLGAVITFLVLAIVGLSSNDSQRVRAAYLAMDLTGWYVLVPLSLASPLSGAVQSLGTRWGLFRHYWVVAKLVMTIPATLVLLLHMRPISHIAGIAGTTELSSTGLGQLRMQLMVNAAAALLVLLATTALSIYKPKGLTPYGWRKADEERVRYTGFVE